MKKFLLIALVAIFSCISVARADEAQDKRKEIEKMLKLSGMEKLMDQMKTQMIDAMKQQTPNVPGDFWTKFESKVDMHSLIQKIIPVYEKYYTLDDIKAINAFYESAAGKKMLAALPQVMQESMKIGQEWGLEIGKEAAKEAEAEAKKNQ